MTSCPHCAASAVELCHAFTNGCPGCMARSVARSPAYAESRKRRALTQDYRQALAKLGLQHQQVKDAAEADFSMKGTT